LRKKPAMAPTRLLALLLLAALALPAALAASFDCKGKLTALEQFVCDDAELSAADEKLAAAYFAAMHAVDAQRRDALRKDQRKWVAQRNGACTLGDYDNASNQLAGKRCLLAYLNPRIELLEKVARGEPLPATPTEKLPPGDVYRRRGDDRMVISPQTGGGAAVSILTGNARGVCDLDLPGKLLAPGKYAFRDYDTNCTVSVTIKGNQADVTSAGHCSEFCGVHADFEGKYLRQAPQPSNH
jgi:uncharacterized protein YecT (DUF1311 family)